MRTTRGRAKARPPQWRRDPGCADITSRHGIELQTVKAKPSSPPAQPPRRWRPGTGIYVIAPLQPSLAAIVGEIQSRFDPKLARLMPPHITIVGSSGAGPIAPNTTPEELHAALAPIAASTPPMTLALGDPDRDHCPSAPAVRTPARPARTHRPQRPQIRQPAIRIHAAHHAQLLPSTVCGRTT
jgi:hypothetical protein